LLENELYLLENELDELENELPLPEYAQMSFMHPMLYWFPSPPGLTHVEFMHPMLYCFEVPELVWV
jgi:hypothetical protein